MRFLSTLLFCAAALFLVACGGNRNDVMDNVEENAGKLDPDSPVADLYTDGKVTIVPMTEEPAEFADAVLNEWAYNDGTFTYGVSGYEFGVQSPDADEVMCANSSKGQHAHLIINNEPYIAKYEPSFGLALPDGEHYILTFLSRSYHLSIKNGNAHRAVKATVAGNSFTDVEDITEPMLFYSRPKGTYTGKKNTENILLDFYPVNVNLGRDGYAVNVEVNGGKTMTLNAWKPYYIQGLPMGENTVTLTLMKDGQPVATPLNPVTRKFTLEEAPVEMGK